MPRERTIFYVCACNLSALENRHFEIYTIIRSGKKKFVDLCTYTHLFIECVFLCNTSFHKICKIWRFDIGFAASYCKFLLSFLKSTLHQQLLVFITSTKAARFMEIWKGKLGNRNITEKNANGGRGWCVFCSELSAKSTTVIDTSVFG